MLNDQQQTVLQQLTTKQLWQTPQLTLIDMPAAQGGSISSSESDGGMSS